MQAAWGSLAVAAPAAAFSLTLQSRTPLVLRSSRRAFSSLTSVRVGGAECNGSVASADGQWLALVTPSLDGLCGRECGGAYATIDVSNPPDPTGAARGAALTCPPFCPGLVGSAGVFPLATSTADGFETFSPAQLRQSCGGGQLAEPLSASAYGSLSSGSVSGSSGSSTGGSSAGASSRVLGYPAGLYISVACSASAIYTDPSTGACTNASDARFPLCAFGSGDACQPCPANAMCPGGARCWPLPGYYTAAESSARVIPCSQPDAALKCTGWSAAFSQTQCGVGYLQVCTYRRPVKLAASPGHIASLAGLVPLWSMRTDLFSLELWLMSRRVLSSKAFGTAMVR